MEDLFDILIPLVIAGVYFFGNMLSKKSGDESEDGLPMPRKREREVDYEQAERQRQVREEIRRKIEARRGEAPPASPGFPNSPPVTTAPPEPARMVRERTKQTDERIHETRKPKPKVVPMPETVDSPYGDAMQAQLAQIEATRKKAAALKAQGAAAARKLRTRERRTSRVGGFALKGPVRQVLRNPAAARSAFVYGEVFGAPVSLRSNGSGALKGEG
jgi:hypothetical protein